MLRIPFHPICKLIIVRAGPRGVNYGGGGTGSRRLEPSGASRERGREGEGVDPPIVGGGSGGAPPEIFLKSMSLRMHFKPF